MISSVTDSYSKSTIYSEAFKKESEGLVLNDPELQKLQARDSEVRAHEAAHIAAGGGVVTGGANLSYTRGSDGKMYAVGGEVPIDMSEGNIPQETINKMQQVKAAALAPSSPSSTDYKVATTATMLEARAMIEMNKEKEGLQAYQAIQEEENSLQFK